MDLLNKIQHQIKIGNLNGASNMLDFLLKSNILNPLIFNLSGILDLRFLRFNEAINKFRKAIDLDKEYAEAYFNLGNLLHNLGNFNEAETYLKSAINSNPNYIKAIFILGENYYLQGKFEFAIKNFLKILDIQNNHQDSFIRVLDLLTLYKKEILIDNNILNYNYAIEKIDVRVNLDKNISNNDIEVINKKILSILPLSYLKNQSMISQILKKNSIDLNCGRHHAIFNKYQIIPKNCFSCFKIQIETKNVIDLIKLYLVFNNLELENNNLRKCFVEMRNEVPGTYKGLIYCSNLDEVDKINQFLIPVLKRTIDNNIIVSIKRGCSEFGNKFDKYKVLKKNELMSYEKDWKKYEQDFDNNSSGRDKPENRIFYPTKKVLTLQDALCIFNWLRYAKKIEDLSYLDLIGIKLPPSHHFDLHLSLQIDYRINQFKKNN